MTASSEWGDLGLAPGHERVFRYGTLQLEAERTRSELWLRVGRVDDDPAPKEPEWTRWAISPEASLSLRPAVPDRLLVVSHQHPFRLAPQGHARVYARIPLNVQVIVHEPGSPEVPAIDVPSLVLSDTWWGTFTEGELAYWLTTKARAAFTPDLFEPHLAMCPFDLTNESDEALPIERFAVRVPHLTLFQCENEQWTDEVQVRYRGAEEGSEIDFGAGPPPEREDAKQVAGPRQRSGRGLRARTFNRLKSMSNLGS